MAWGSLLNQVVGGIMKGRGYIKKKKREEGKRGKGTEDICTELKMSNGNFI